MFRAHHHQRHRRGDEDRPQNRYGNGHDDLHGDNSCVCCSFSPPVLQTARSSFGIRADRLSKTSHSIQKRPDELQQSHSEIKCSKGVFLFLCMLKAVLIQCPTRRPHRKTDFNPHSSCAVQNQTSQQMTARSSSSEKRNRRQPFDERKTIVSCAFINQCALAAQRVFFHKRTHARLCWDFSLVVTES